MEKNIKKNNQESLSKVVISWYYESGTSSNYSKIERLKELKTLIDFIEKMASWYEIRYPSYVFSSEKSDDILLKNNMKWDDLLNYDTFLKTLNKDEKKFLQNFSFKTNYHFKDADIGKVDIDDDGFIKAYEIRLNVSEHIENLTIGKMLYITDDFDGLDILQAMALMKEYGMDNDALGMQNILDEYQMQIEARARLLDCVMYRIIERDKYSGIKRAYLFAKEFERNISIPLIYGIGDENDYDLINNYLLDGGSTNLVCYQGYNSSDNVDDLKTITINDVIENEFKLNEKDLYKRLINSLNNKCETMHRKLK